MRFICYLWSGCLHPKTINIDCYIRSPAPCLHVIVMKKFSHPSRNETEQRVGKRGTLCTKCWVDICTWLFLLFFPIDKDHNAAEG